MPRAARLDIPGVLQHVIFRGVERRDIFLNDTDRLSFLERFSSLLTQTGTECLAWSLMSNHVHLLLRPTKDTLGHFMRRLLTGHKIFGVRFDFRIFQQKVIRSSPYLSEQSDATAKRKKPGDHTACDLPAFHSSDLSLRRTIL